MPTLLETVNALLAQQEQERELIKGRRAAELAAVEAQIAVLKKAQKKLQGDGEIDVLVSELVARGLWPPRV